MNWTYLEKEDVARVAALPYQWYMLRGKTLLVSGGTGFIGSVLNAVIQYRNDFYGDCITVVNISRQTREDSKFVKNITADVTKKFSYGGRVDYVLHLASNTHPKQYNEDPVGTITGNVLGCYNLLELAREKGAERFLLASSVEIYGQGIETPMTEDFSGYVDCNTFRAGYNEAKRTCESLCASYNKQYGLNYVT